jgi:predicted enzyme related to lactoylglutathione lyase
LSSTYQSGAVLYAKNPKILAEFYERVTGMPIRRTAADHIVLESGSFQLVVLQIPEHIAKSITIESPPVQREQTAIKLVFFVDDLAHAREAAGGALNGPEREWKFDGATVCDGYDPEGNNFQLRCKSAIV